MELKETDQKGHGKTLIVFVIVLSILLALTAAIAIYQTTKVVELKTSIVEKDKIIAANLGKITGLEADVTRLKNDMGSMALQAANDQKEIKALKHSLSEFTTVAAGLITLAKECLNYCGSKFVPGVLKGLKEFEALIDQLAKAEAS